MTGLSTRNVNRRGKVRALLMAACIAVTCLTTPVAKGQRSALPPERAVKVLYGTVWNPSGGQIALLVQGRRSRDRSVLVLAWHAGHLSLSHRIAAPPGAHSLTWLGTHEAFLAVGRLASAGDAWIELLRPGCPPKALAPGFSPVASPDGSRFMYMDLQGGLQLRDLKSGTTHLVAGTGHHTGNVVYPGGSWSPDGRYFAFFFERLSHGPGGALAVLDTRTKTVRDLVSDPVGYWHIGIYWSNPITILFTVYNSDVRLGLDPLSVRDGYPSFRVNPKGFRVDSINVHGGPVGNVLPQGLAPPPMGEVQLLKRYLLAYTSSNTGESFVLVNLKSHQVRTTQVKGPVSDPVFSPDGR